MTVTTNPFLREPHLKQLAAMTGVSYAWLGASADLTVPLAAHAQPRTLKVATDVRALPGSLALVLLVALYVTAALAALAARRQRASPSSA